MGATNQKQKWVSVTLCMVQGSLLLILLGRQLAPSAGRLGSNMSSTRKFNVNNIRKYNVSSSRSSKSWWRTALSA